MCGLRSSVDIQSIFGRSLGGSFWTIFAEDGKIEIHVTGIKLASNFDCTAIGCDFNKIRCNVQK
jgi:hypothetical protein